MNCFKILIITIVLFTSCKKSKDNSYKNIIEVYNNTECPIKIKVYKGMSVDSGIVFKSFFTKTYFSIGTGSSPFTETDSIVIEFINGKSKKDYNCFQLNESEQIDCISDSISLYNIKRYEISTILNGEIDKYYVSAADSIESK